MLSWYHSETFQKYFNARLWADKIVLKIFQNDLNYIFEYWLNISNISEEYENILW